MKLEQMFPDFLYMTFEQQRYFVRNYRLQRETDMQKTPPPRKRGKSSAFSTLSPEMKELVKELGLTPAAIKQLKASMEKEDES